VTAGVVVDTDVFSFVYKGDSRAAGYAPHLTGQPLHLAFVTIAELYRWSVLHGWGQQRVDDLRGVIANYTVLGYDDETAWEWARLMSIKGRPVAPGDAWVAAVATRHGLPLVTHNRKHFDGLPGLTVISDA
jgi:tRNA(fMet)-specific endonuclease VapC